MRRSIIRPRDVFLLKRALWPHVHFYDKQIEIIRSVLTDSETIVPAAAQVGKDFVAGFITVACFTLCVSQDVQCKIVTSSATREHLSNLWGEIDYFMRTSEVPLSESKGGKITYFPTGQTMGRVGESLHDGSQEKITNSYVVARVITNENKGEGLQGHHAPWTLWMADECSGMSDTAYRMACGWSKHRLLIGNPWPANNFFERGVEAGDLIAS